MHFKFRGVNEAFRELVKGIHTGTIPTYLCASRYGEVMMVEEPVIVTYEKPRERVLFNAARDCNPFMHMYEALWMLAGRNDVAPLVYYCKRMAEFSDDGVTFNGAYGHRWRHARDNVPNAYHINQINVLIDHLRRKPESRRAVLQMWDVEKDLLSIDSSKDVCCNTCIYFSIGWGDCLKCNGTGRGPKMQGSFTAVDHSYACPKCKGLPHDQPRYLNMTVCNRSNDMIWGMLGANAVHFSILQEYVAAHLELEVGVYNQITNNLHVYTNNWKPEKWLAESDMCYSTSIFSLGKTLAAFDRDLPDFVEQYGGGKHTSVNWEDEFLRYVAQPMLDTYWYHKQGDNYKWRAVDSIRSDDWRYAAQEWLERREVHHATAKSE